MTKNIIAFILGIVFTSTVMPSVYAEGTAPWKEIYVDVNGDDSARGTREAPFKTIQRAKEEVKTISDGMKGDIVVNIADGIYYQEETLIFRPEDSGKNGYNVIYRGSGNSIVSGGRTIEMKKSEKYPGLYEGTVKDRGEGLREFSVNGEKRWLAASEIAIYPLGNYKKTKDSVTDGFYVSKDDVQVFDDLEYLELSCISNWTHSVIFPKSITEDPDDPNRLIFDMGDSYSHWASFGNNTFHSYNKFFKLQNHIALLDNPGEFYYDRDTQTMYYMPMKGEDENSLFVASYLDYAIIFDGKSNKNKVKNITIENLTITEYASNDLDAESRTNQAYSYYALNNNKTGDGDMGAINLERADNIVIANNVIKNIGDVGIRFYNDCSNCKAVGNAISDIGGTAIGIGSFHNYQYVSRSDDDEDLDIIKDDAPTGFMMNFKMPAIRTSSDEFNDKSNMYNAALHMGGNLVWAHKTFVEDFSGDLSEYRGKIATWHDKISVAKGEKAYVRYDFRTPYNYSEIALLFDEDVSQEEKSNYEILLSNDREFKDGSYVKVAEKIDPSDNVERFTLTDEGRYRYVMIRKIAPGPFALSFGMIFSEDLDSDHPEKMCDGIEISNNYIARAGDQRHSDIALFVTACNNLKMIHNEVWDVPYSAVSVGWGWSGEWDCGTNVDISYNYLHDFMNVLYDGGGIYTLSLLKNCTETGNYVKNTHGGTSYYLDQGSSGITLTDNVGENVRGLPNSNVLSAGTDPNYISGYYTNQIVTGETAYGLIWKDTINVYVPGNEPNKVQEIKKNAGPTAEYRHMKSKISDNQPLAYSIWTELDDKVHQLSRVKGYSDALRDNIQRMAKEGEFGDEYGKYSYDAKYKISDMKDWSKYNSWISGEGYRFVYEDVEGSLKREESLTDMIKVSKEKLNSVKPVSESEMKTVSSDDNCVLKADYDKFKTEIERMEKLNDLSTQKDFDYKLQLEMLYNDFSKKCSRPMIANVYVKGQISSEIDAENKKVIVKVGNNISSEASLIINPASNTVLADDVPSLKLNEDIVIPICVPAYDKYSFWTIRVETPAVGDKIDVCDFATDCPDTKMIREGNDNSVTLAPLQNTFIYALRTTAVNTEKQNSIDFKVYDSVVKNKFTFMLGGENLYGYDFSSNDARYNCIEVSCDNNLLYIRSLNSGNRQTLYCGAQDIYYGKKNTISWKLTPVDGNTLVSVNMNGKDITVMASGIYDGGSLGVYSKNNTMTLYN